jgi:hypothetical protein
MNDTLKCRYAELESHRLAAYSAPIGTTRLTYSLRGMCRRLVVPVPRTKIADTAVQNTMCHIVSAIGYLNPEYARMYLLNRITDMEMVIHTVT